MATIVVRSGPFKGRSFEVSAAGAGLGRDPARVDIVLGDVSTDQLSREHARVTLDRTGGRWMLEHLSRTNPSWVDGVTLAWGSSAQRAALEHHSVIVLGGQVTAVFLCEARPPPPLPPPVPASALDPQLLEDIAFSVERGYRRRQALGEIVAQVNDALDGLDSALRRADQGALRATLEDQLEPRPGTLRDAADRLGGVSDALEDALELLGTVGRAGA
ncbi:MAG: FHA domain-containing protein [Alphaproteobacteria bacterium]|nr:FHA domain-containing protein [Alphaproteobacteria bacterium]